MLAPRVLNILFVSLEVFPWVKVGGIADAVAALTHALASRGHRLTVAAPRREGVSYETRDASSVAIVPLDIEGYRSGDLYGHDVMESSEESLRHAALARAVMELIAERAGSGAPFDIVHVHDWPLAMIPYLLREKRMEISPTTRSVLTIHNVAFQGIMPPEAVMHFGLDPAVHLRDDRLLFHGRASMLKAGVVAADALTTVSPTYARDLLTPEHGQLLDDILRARRERGSPIHGILNGIDVEVWNPKTDVAIAARYDADGELALERVRVAKATCKSALLTELGLEGQAERPLLAYVGRLFYEKGADILAASLDGLAARGANVVVVGTGDAASVDAITRAAANASTTGATVKVLGWVSEESVHRIFAGADALLVPSRIEPCGLVQMYAQRYGTLPIARRTGGLIDTIVDLDERPSEGQGLLFDGETKEALLAAVDRWLGRAQTDRLAAAVRAMRLVRDWSRPAAEYERAYVQARSLPPSPTA